VAMQHILPDIANCMTAVS